MIPAQIKTQIKKLKNLLKKRLSLIIILAAFLVGGLFVAWRTSFLNKILNKQYVKEKGIYIEGIHQQGEFQILQGEVVEVKPNEETLALERNGKKEQVLFQGGEAALRIEDENGKLLSFKDIPFSEIEIGDEAVFNDIKKTEYGWEGKKLIIIRR